MLDLLELIIAAFLFWRLALCFLGAVLLSVALTVMVPAFNGSCALVLVLLASTFGIYWHGRAEVGVGILEKSPAESAPSSQISAPVALLGCAFIGFIFGAFFLQINKSVVISALSLLFCSIPLVAWQRWVLAKRIAWPYLCFLYLATLLGFAGNLIFLK